MSTFIVTTGTSITTHSRCWMLRNANIAQSNIKRLNLERSMDEILDMHNGEAYLQEMRGLRRTLVTENTEGKLDPATLDRILTDCAYQDCWSEAHYHRFPAEVATLYKMTQPDHRGASVLTKGDKVIFVGSMGSNSTQAQLCQRIFQTACETHDLGIDSSCTLIKHNWDPKHEADFEAAMTELCELSAGTFCNAAGPLPKFVVSGGYKATIIKLAIYADTSFRTRGYSLYYLNDESSDVIHLTREAVAAN